MLFKALEFSQYRFDDLAASKEAPMSFGFRRPEYFFTRPILKIPYSYIAFGGHLEDSSTYVR
jgi:hypothetical protein